MSASGNDPLAAPPQIDGLDGDVIVSVAPDAVSVDHSDLLAFMWGKAKDEWKKPRGV